MFLTAILRRKQATRFFSIAFFMFFQILKIRNGTHTKNIYNHDDFVSIKYFPVTDVNKSTKGKASFIEVADVQ